MSRGHPGIYTFATTGKKYHFRHKNKPLCGTKAKHLFLTTDPKVVECMKCFDILKKVKGNPILPEIGSGIVAGIGIGTGWSLVDYAKGKLRKNRRKK